jgi:hypothetical protein
MWKKVLLSIRVIMMSGYAIRVPIRRKRKAYEKQNDR